MRLVRYATANKKAGVVEIGLPLAEILHPDPTLRHKGDVAAFYT
jgi:hypothetical protein